MIHWQIWMGQNFLRMTVTMMTGYTTVLNNVTELGGTEVARLPI